MSKSRSRVFRVLPSQETLASNADVALLVVGLASLAAPVFVIRNPQSIVYPTAVLGAATILLASAHYSPSHGSPDIVIEIRPRVLSLSYFSLFFVSLIFYLQAGFQRTSVVNVLLLGMYLVVFLRILSRSRPCRDLGLLLATGLLHRTMILFASTLPYGADPQFHLRIAEEIGARGSLAPLLNDKYYFAPFYHLNIATEHLLLATPVRLSGFLFVSVLFLVVPSLCIFVLLRGRWGYRIAAVGSFLWVVGDYAIRWSVRTHVVSLGIILFSLVLFSVIRYFQKKSYIYFCLTILFYVFLLLSHHASSFITLVGAGIFAGTAGLYSSSRLQSGLRITGTMVTLLIFHWTITKIGVGPGQSFFDRVFATSTAKLIRVGATSIGSDISPSELPFTLAGQSNSLTIPHVVGPGILFGLAIIGGVYWMRRQRIDFWLPFSTLVAVGGMYVFVFVGPLVGFDHFQSGRWIGYTYVLLAIIAAPAIGLLIQSLEPAIGRKTTVITVALLLVGPYIALMGANANASPDSPIIPAPGVERLSFSEEERALMVHTEEYGTDRSRGYSDFRTAQVLRRYYGVPVRTVRIQTERRRLEIERDDMLITRPYFDSGNALFLLRSEGRLYAVHGKIPIAESDTAGCGLIYQSQGGSNLNTVPWGIYYC